MPIKMKKFISMFALLAMLIPFVANAQEQETKDTLLRANTDTLMKHIRILSSSQYEGRMAGSEAYLDAANYCCGVLASYGVQPFQGEWGQYFEVEQYFLQPTQTAVLSQKFAHMLLRLNCYLQMDVVQFPGETSVTNPPPAQLRTWLSDCLSARHPAIQTLFVLIPETESMFSICQEDTYMTLYNPSPSLQRLASQLAQAEGLFLWSPADGE